jgi:lipid-binding SYLF domain-containing protein
VEVIVRKFVVFALSALLAIPAIPAFAGDSVQDRLQESGKVLQEIIAMPDGVPQDLLNKAECVVVLPSVKKVAIGFGGSYGRGAMSCRSGEHYTGPWSAPVMMALEGGSWGLQLGGSSTDIILLLMNPRAADSLLNNEVKLGVDASAAAGPKGRTAEASTDASMKAEILSYSRSRGLFAGIALNGARLHPDGDANEKVYGKEINAKNIITKPGSTSELMVSELNKISPRNESDKDSLRDAPKRDKK